MVPASFDFCLANFKLRGELRGDFHPFGELEPEPASWGRRRCHHVDRQGRLS